MRESFILGGSCAPLRPGIRWLLSMNETVIVEYLPQYGRELVQMWQDSFAHAVGIRDPHSFEDQLHFVEQELVRSNSVVIVLQKGAGKVVGFLAATPNTISQLYVHVDHQGKGVGTILVNLAKKSSNGSLRLFTFERNKDAQRFYGLERKTMRGRWSLLQSSCVGSKADIAGQRVRLTCSLRLAR